MESKEHQEKHGTEQYGHEQHEKQEMIQHLDRLASVGQIAAGIAHEVRNPLTSVKGFIQLLQKDSPHPYLDIARSELDHAILTLQNLLQVSKPDFENEDFQQVNLCVEIESVLSLFQDQFYRIDFQVELHNRETKIIVQKNLLKKAFFNLLKNAVEAIPDKGKIVIEHRAFKDSVQIIFRDTGTGIPQEKIALLGTPFFSTKEEGTGMGLTQVFTTIYQHGGKIDVNSSPNQGTEFIITLPMNRKRDQLEGKDLHLEYVENYTKEQFFNHNKEKFEQALLSAAESLNAKLEQLKNEENIDLLTNAHKLAVMTINEQEHDVITLAKEAGQRWAKQSMSLAYKLEWIRAVREVIWKFIFQYEKMSNQNMSVDNLFLLERKVNDLLDHFMHYFFLSYSNFKDKLLRSHRELIEELSVPIIPLSSTVSILPVIGMIDTYRAQKIQETVLSVIDQKKIKRIIVDVSGVAFMDTAIVSHMFKIFEGIKLMGCQAVLTGMRSEIANTIVNLGISLGEKVIIKSTLEQAIDDFGLEKM